MRRLIQPLRDLLGRRMHRVLDQRVAAALDQRLPALEARALERARAEVAVAADETRTELRRDRTEPRVEGPATRLRIAASARVGNALLETRSGFVTVADDAVVEAEAALVTSAGDGAGGDVTVSRGAVIGARAVLVGPCWIAPGQVVAPGSVLQPTALADPLPSPADDEPEALAPELAGVLEEGLTVVDAAGTSPSAIAHAIGASGKLLAFVPDPEHRRELEAVRAARALDTVELIPAAPWQDLDDVPAVALDDAIPLDVHVDVIVARGDTAPAVLDGAQELLRRCRPVVVGASISEPPPSAERARHRNELHDRPWQRAVAPPRLRYAASMLSIRELGLLHWLARDHWSGQGAIVDLGSFVGGSTVALASGLVARRDGTRGRIVHAYDQFVLVGDVAPETLHRFGWEARVEQSALPMFNEAIRGLGGLVEIHAGDLLEQRWHGEPIELLFVDVAKSWQLNDHLMREFLPHLVPDRGVLVQQDFADEWHPWVVIAMELLADYFEWLDVVPHGSVVYRCRRPVPLDALPRRLREDLGPERLVELFDRGVARLEGELRLVAELGAVGLLADIGRFRDARERLDATLRRGATSARVTRDAGPRVAEWLAAVSP